MIMCVQCQRITRIQMAQCKLTQFQYIPSSQMITLKTLVPLFNHLLFISYSYRILTKRQSFTHQQIQFQKYTILYACYAAIPIQHHELTKFIHNSLTQEIEFYLKQASHSNLIYLNSMKDLIKAVGLASCMFLAPTQALRLNTHDSWQMPQGCSTYNNSLNQCAMCAWRWVKIDGECHAVDDQCQTWDENADCTSCYWGRHVQDGECVLDNGEDENNDGQDGSDGTTWVEGQDPNCKVFVDGECEQCYFYFWVNDDGDCEQVSAQCNGYNPENGHCTACWGGYTLNEDGECQV